jgi:hypothetical protein
MKSPEENIVDDWPIIPDGMYGLPPYFSDELLALIADFRGRGETLDEIEDALETTLDSLREHRRNLQISSPPSESKGE